MTDFQLFAFIAQFFSKYSRIGHVSSIFVRNVMISDILYVLCALVEAYAAFLFDYIKME